MGETVVHRFPDRCAELLRLDISRADARVESLEASLVESRDMRDKYLSVIECSNNTAHRRAERIAALEAENALLREDKARLVEALESIRNWRPPDGTLLQVKDLQWFKKIDAARKKTQCPPSTT